MSTSKSIKITYTLNPPSSAPSDVPKSKSHVYPIAAPPIQPEEDKAGKAYYDQLRKSLEAARLEVGEELTMWRDLVGKAEVNKEPKKNAEEEEVDEEEE
jgi:hypothetical protein